MTRIKKPIDYINELRLSHNPETQNLEKTLHKQYNQWTHSLSLKDFINFLQTIQNNKNQIGLAQFFGKFRAYSLEEFLYRLIQTKVSIPKPLDVYWGEKCLVWRENGQEYGIEQDILIGKKINEFIEPVVAIDAKIELDSSRLKTTLASFLLLKHQHPKAKCYLAYIFTQINSTILKLTKPWINETYQLSKEKDETTEIIKSIRNAINHF